MSELTLLRLESALQRLLNGVPKRTPADGKINVSRVNDEAGLSKSHINYYQGFVTEAKEKIKQHFEGLAEKELKADVQEKKTEVQRLKELLAHEKRLKKKYRAERNEQKLLSDNVVKLNVSLAFRVMELESELHLLSKHRVTSLHQT